MLRRGPLRYVLAIVLTGLALAVRLAIAPQQVGLPFVTFFPAVALAAIMGGMGAGLLSTAIGVVLATYFFIPPFNEWVLSREALSAGAIFCADGLLISFSIESLHRYYRGYVTVIDELRAAQAAETAARQEAERASQAKSRFLAAASHDLRQPYQALRLYHAVLQQACKDEFRSSVLARMETAMASGEALLQSLLDISTLEAGLIVPKMAAASIAEVLAGIDAKNRVTAEEKGLRFRVRARCGTVVTDPVLLARILDNLIANAIRYTAKGGILVACRMQGGRAVFQVWDTGVGIPSEHQQAVFEEFFQVDNPERDRSKGVGLGLAVVRKASGLLGAEIALRSRLGRGTVVEVALPHAPPPAGDQGPVSA
ncbi:MAG: sensor histidine kinase [Solirubrobacterales bacterium]